VISGAISTLLSLFIYEYTPLLGYFGPSSAGVVEDIGKLAALLVVMRTVKNNRYKFRLNALLLGAAVGAGFAAFESAGYALIIGFVNSDEMLANITIRGALSPFSHLVWTAIAASAFWIARPHHKDMWDTVKSPMFLKIFSIPVVLHFVWNLPFNGPFMVKYLLLGFVAWVVIISLVQSGLREISESVAVKELT
jgi:RsiW-degrading membrane proteinase PrsW (M82 family)